MAVTPRKGITMKTHPSARPGAGSSSRSRSAPSPPRPAAPRPPHPAHRTGVVGQRSPRVGGVALPASPPAVRGVRGDAVPPPVRQVVLGHPDPPAIRGRVAPLGHCRPGTSRTSRSNTSGASSTTSCPAPGDHDEPGAGDRVVQCLGDRARCTHVVLAGEHQRRHRDVRQSWSQVRGGEGLGHRHLARAPDPDGQRAGPHRPEPRPDLLRSERPRPAGVRAHQHQ